MNRKFYLCHCGKHCKSKQGIKNHALVKHGEKLGYTRKTDLDAWKKWYIDRNLANWLELSQARNM